MGGKRRMMYWAWVVPLPLVFRPVVHADCKHCEWSALTERHLLPVDLPTPAAIARLQQHANHLVAKLRKMANGTFTPWRHQRVVDCYDGPKRRKYAKAMDSLRYEGPIISRDAKIECFVKAEKRNINQPKKPRCIQFRTPRYTLALLAYLKPVAKVMDRLYSHTNPRGPRTRVFPVGMNLHRRAELIRKKFRSVDDCVALSMDASGFDYRVSAEMLAVEHSVYTALNPDKYLQRMLSYQLINEGRTKHGVRYWSYGRRMSGDANTSLGNRMLMYLMILSSMPNVPYEVLVDGDDAIVFVPRKYAAMAQEMLVQGLANCGHKLVVETVCEHIDQIVFNQGKISWGAGGWRLTRDPWKVLGTAFASHVHFHEKKGGLRALRTLAQSLLVINLGVPVLQSFAIGVLRSVQEVAWLDLAIDNETLKNLRLESDDWHSVQPAAITQLARQSYEKVWGISPEQQVSLERYLERDRSDVFRSFEFITMPEVYLESATDQAGMIRVGDVWNE